MRSILPVLILLVGLCCSYGDKFQENGYGGILEGSDSAQRRDDNQPNDAQSRKDIRSEIKKRHVHSIDHQHDPDIIYPCDYEDDVDCIRNYFESIEHCVGVHNHERKPVYRERLVTYLPSINLTIVFTNSRIKYIGDRISRFYINKRTGYLVMSVDFEAINSDTRKAYFIYQRRGQDPIKLVDYDNATFAVTLTAVIPLDRGFKESRVTAYVPSYSFDIGPKVLNNTDPLVVKVNKALFANAPAAVLEYYLTEAPSQFFGYLQKYICDFGIPIST